MRAGEGRAGRRGVCALAAGLGAAVLLACGPGPVPPVVVTGPAADVLRFHDWEPFRVGDRVVRWDGRMTREKPDPLGYVVYTLYDPAGNPLSRATLDYRNAFVYDGQRFEPGDSLPITIAARGGRGLVARIEIEVQRP